MRSAYWQVTKNVPRDADGRPVPAWSLSLEWAGRPESRGRRARLRLYRAGSGRKKAAGLPKSQQWWRNPAQQSGGIGSGRERFG